MIVRPADVERFVARPAPAIAAALIYGSNRGLAADRAERLGRAVAGALDDPFRVADLAPAAVAAEPTLLMDEAAALAMTGGRRVVRLRGAGNEVAQACANLLAAAVPAASLVVVEAGELPRRARLRVVFESAGNAAAIACYDDDRAALGAVLTERLAAHGKTATPAAREAVLARLGGDRKAALAEIDKLVLYAGESARIGEADALACVGDGAEATLDDLADAVAVGDRPGAGRAFDKLAADGVSPVRALGALQRHFQHLHWAAGRVRGGAAPAAAVEALRPPVFFKRRRSMAAQLARWPAAAAARALELLLEAEAACKTTGAPAALICSRAALRLTEAAGRRSRRG